ncbi:hypothetical protein ACL02R_27260 [Streptomyces sp. MS19]|uniref:hypothetical protein n=1 Tax=Streptomyces sp. MS19 TaxID=3385972 RepID=UPI00399EEF89
MADFSTLEEKYAAARKRVLDAREKLTEEYCNGRSANSISKEYRVSATWLAKTLDEWGVPRRGREEAAAMRNARSQEAVTPTSGTMNS